MGAIQGPINGVTSTDAGQITRDPRLDATTANALSAPVAADGVNLEPVLPRDEWHGREQFVTKRIDARRALDDIEQRMNWRWTVGGGGEDGNFPPVQAMYGATVGPIDRPDFQPLYGAVVGPIEPPDFQPLYGAVVGPIAPPELQPMYGVTIKPPVQPPFDPPFQPPVQPPFQPFPVQPPFFPWLPFFLPNPESSFGFWNPGCGADRLDRPDQRQFELASRFDELWRALLFGF